jgi:hypothetical protein
MTVLHKEACASDSDAEIRAGYASWDKGRRKCISVKFTWFDKRGHACRGGEVPVAALPQMIAVAIKHGYLKQSEIIIAKSR